MNRNAAYAIVTEYVKNENLIRHMLSVEAAMRAYAAKYGGDPDYWALPGLLHDFDWEIHPTLEEHPQKGAAILREQGVPEDVIRCIQSHAPHTGVPREIVMDRALFAVDELTGLITACALVRPSRSLHDLTAKSVKGKWKDRAFAAGVNRADIEQGARELGVDLNEHITLVIAAMRGIASTLGLEGTTPPAETSAP
ncbi:MAG: HDIG domain-containing protein [Anaerolineales bacterium]|nr:HDIG domain-containing protein [Anaerolineales bacterium]